MKTIIALQPEARRIGYAIFEEGRLIDWGSKYLESEPLRERINIIAVPFFKTIMAHYKPEVVVLPAPTKTFGTARNRFLRAIRYELVCQRATVSTYSRRDIQQRFKFIIRSERPNKHSIMQVLVKRFPELLRFLPKPRRRWESEDYWTPMYDAV